MPSGRGPGVTAAGEAGGQGGTGRGRPAGGEVNVEEQVLGRGNDGATEQHLVEQMERLALGRDHLGSNVDQIAAGDLAKMP